MNDYFLHPAIANAIATASSTVSFFYPEQRVYWQRLSNRQQTTAAKHRARASTQTPKRPERRAAQTRELRAKVRRVRRQHRGRVG